MKKIVEFSQKTRQGGHISESEFTQLIGELTFGSRLEVLEIGTFKSAVTFHGVASRTTHIYILDSSVDTALFLLARERNLLNLVDTSKKSSPLDSFEFEVYRLEEVLKLEDTEGIQTEVVFANID